MIDTLLLFAVIFVDGVIAGLFVCSTMVEQSALKFDGSQWVTYKQAKELVFGPIMPPFFGLSVILTIASAVILPAHLPFAIAAVLLVASGVVTGTIHVPLNKEMMTWSVNPAPAEWVDARKRWLSWNIVRTIPAVLAFAIVAWVVVR